MYLMISLPLAVTFWCRCGLLSLHLPLHRLKFCKFLVVISPRFVVIIMSHCRHIGPFTKTFNNNVRNNVIRDTIPDYSVGSCLQIRPCCPWTSVPHLMCWPTEGTFTTARCCSGAFVIQVPDIKLPTYLLTYLLERTVFMLFQVTF